MEVLFGSGLGSGWTACAGSNEDSIENSVWGGPLHDLLHNLLLNTETQSDEEAQEKRRRPLGGLFFLRVLCVCN
jgi:hypothetical protein